MKQHKIKLISKDNLNSMEKFNRGSAYQQNQRINIFSSKFKILIL